MPNRLLPAPLSPRILGTVSYVLEVLTELVPKSRLDWVHLCTLDESKAALAATAYAAAKRRYPRVRLRKHDGSIIEDSQDSKEPSK